MGTARVLSDGVCNAYVVDVWTLSAYGCQGIARIMLELLLQDLRGQHIFLFTDETPGYYCKLGFMERGGLASCIDDHTSSLGVSPNSEDFQILSGSGSGRLEQNWPGRPLPQAHPIEVCRMLFAARALRLV